MFAYFQNKQKNAHILRKVKLHQNKAPQPQGIVGTGCFSEGLNAGTHNWTFLPPL